MSSPSSLKICLSAVPSTESDLWAAEISALSIGSSAYALVLDLSDSCGSLRAIGDRLPALFKPLGSRTALWIYRFSSSGALDSGADTIGHLQDGSLKISRWLDDRLLRQTAVNQGSFARPVFDAVALRMLKERKPNVQVVILTDGEVLDRSAIDIPGGCGVVGICECPEDSKTMHWRRAFPNSPLFAATDRLVEKWVSDRSEPFCGVCDVSCHETGAPIRIRAHDLEENLTSGSEGELLSWNLASKPLVLGFRQRQDAIQRTVVRCQARRTGQTLEMQLNEKMDEVSEAARAIVAQAWKQKELPGYEVLVDCTSGEPGFNELWQDTTRAVTLADKRASWTDSKGIATVYTSERARSCLLNEDGQFRWHALLCLYLATAALEGSRVVILGLSRRAKPAINWSCDHCPDFISVDESTLIEFDSTDRRWLLTRGSMRHELNPRGSQRLELGKVRGTTSPWSALFFGSLS